MIEQRQLQRDGSQGTAENIFKPELVNQQTATTSASGSSHSTCDKCRRSIDPKSDAEIRFNDRFYHADCFTCALCNSNLGTLADGRFKLHDSGDPVCSQCELSHARTCYGCNRPIVRAGSVAFDEQHYHRDCFRCCRCQQSLVDESNLRKDEHQPYCTRCYERFVAARCHRCSQPISSGKSAVYDGKTFHDDCFRCHQCRRAITDSRFARHDEQPWCVQCFTEHVLPKCAACSQPIVNSESVIFDGQKYHGDCFRCSQCRKLMVDVEFRTSNAKVFCQQCYDEHWAPECARCATRISTGRCVIYNGNRYHSDCFRCGQCDRVITDSTFHREDDKPCCSQCYDERFATFCERCCKPISAGRSIIFDAKTYHPDCFRCGQCDRLLTDSQCQIEKSKPCCSQCSAKYFRPQCSKCSKPILDQYTTLQEKHFHIDCLSSV